MTISFVQVGGSTAGHCEGNQCSGRTSVAANTGAFLCQSGGTPGALTDVGTLASSEANGRMWNFDCEVPAGTTWGGGTWTVRFNVTGANMNLTVTEIYICRTNSSCVSQGTIGSATGLSLSLSATGVITQTVTGSAVTPAANDRVTIVICGTNGAMSSQNATITGDQTIDSPFTGVATHATSGALAGQGALINGSAVLHKKHATTGSIIGPGALINGSAAHVAKHATSGALVGPGALISGSAVHNAKHATTGALTGQGSAISGAAARTRNHPTTGALAGQGALITGVAARMRQHPTVGALLGQGAIIVGSATRTSPAANTHNASGALVGQGSVIAGVAAHIAIHGTSGALVGSGASISGSASRSGASPVVAAQAMILRPRHRRRGNVSF